MSLKCAAEGRVTFKMRKPYNGFQPKCVQSALLIHGLGICGFKYLQLLIVFGRFSEEVERCSLWRAPR